MMAKFDLPPDYNDVNSRIVEFRDKFPEGCLQQVSLDFREVNGGWWVIYTAAAYRNPDDPRPGHGTAWEPVPGKTPFTKDAELQNAETAAWGRAIVAVLAADTKKGIASAEEVRNRQSPLSPVDVIMRHHNGDRAAAAEAARGLGHDLATDDGKAAYARHLTGEAA